MPWGRYRLAVAAALMLAVGVPGSVASPSSADAPQTASIRIDPGAKNNGYTTPNITLAQGGTLTVVNFDDMRHSVTSQEADANGNKLFGVDVDGGGSTVTVPGVSNLAPGTYHFFCHFHPTTMRGTLTISGSGGGVQPAPQTFEQPLVRPKALTTSTIKMKIRQVGVRVLPHGPLTTMWTYGGTYPGPTIRRPAGHDTKVTFVNDLPVQAGLSVHFHGDHHRWTADGQPTRYLISQNKSRTYDYPLTDGGHPERASFQWYHDHRMGYTTRNNWRGLQGMFIVTDSMSGKLGLPGGSYDVPLMVSERSFDSNNQLVNPPSHTAMMTTGPLAPPDDGTVGDHILVNGRYAPYLNVSTHRYRLRLLNTSPFTTYDFALSDGHPFVQVGTGNGLLPKAVVRQDILLGPAQRADVVVDFHGELGTSVVLESIPRQNPPKNGAGTPSAQIMQFRVTTNASDSSTVPSALQPAPKVTVPSKVSAVWSVGVTGNQSSGSAWTLDGKVFDPKRVVLKVPRGATQLWELRNPTTVTHFIHIHEEQWRTVQRDGKAPPAWERGLEDTWRLDPGETVRVVAKFTDYTGVFMIHCHMLDHEDDGLMSQFAVVDPKTRALPSGYKYQPTGGPAARANFVAAPRTVSGQTQPAPIVQELLDSGAATTSSDVAAWICAPPGSTTASGRPQRPAAAVEA